MKTSTFDFIDKRRAQPSMDFWRQTNWDEGSLRKDKPQNCFGGLAWHCAVDVGGVFELGLELCSGLGNY